MMYMTLSFWPIYQNYGVIEEKHRVNFEVIELDICCKLKVNKLGLI